MGLDQMGYAKKAEDEGNEDNISLVTWRKHPNLHGFMEQLWISRMNIEGQLFDAIREPMEKDEDGKWKRCLRPPREGDFNCIELELFPDEIDALEKAVERDNLPETVGFFFGRSFPEDQELDREFIKKAREQFKLGNRVFYNSWW